MDIFLVRFFAALILSTIPMLGVFLGVIVGTILAPIFGWVDVDRFGDFYLKTFVNNYFLFILPNMFFAGSLIFAMATKWKNTTISFLAILIIIVGYIISGTLISDIDNETIAALSDTFCIRAYALDTKYYTPIEKNTLSPSLTGLLFLNRLIWMTIGGVVLLIAYLQFSFKEKSKKKVNKVKKTIALNISTFTLPKLNIVYTKKTSWLQFKSFFFLNFLGILKSVTFKIMAIFSAILLISDLVGGFEYYGLQSYPLTYKVIESINGAEGIFLVIILVFFSGEFIWRDRESKINEVIDATAHTSFISMVAKALSLLSAITILHAVFVFCGIIYQLLNGYTRIELTVYSLDFLYNHLMTYIIWSGVMIMIQVVLNNKYLGYFISILVIFLWNIILFALDIESNMLSIASRPSLMYSDMNSFGPGLYGAMMFNLYWGLFSLICLLVAGAFWNRGVTNTFKNRIKNVKKQIPKSYKTVIFLIAIIWILVASFVYYNTQILNPYKTSDQEDKLSADYEKKYKKYQRINLPKITGIKYFIDIFPYRKNVHVKAFIKLTNQSNVPIDSIHYNIDKEWNPEFKIPDSERILRDKKFGYLIYKLKNPLLPNETLEVEIRTKYLTKGFGNNRGNIRVIKNGTFLNNFEVLPTMGYNSNVELSDKNTRKKYNLKPKDRMPKLEENCTQNCMENYLTSGLSDYINVETIISTSEDQTAIAPGTLLKKWVKNERNYYHYKVDHPSQNFYSFISAKYKIKKRKWRDIDIEVYYDKKHPKNIDIMLDAVERSLAYYIENFGPYTHKQCRIIEFPRYATFAQAFPGTMPYSESIGFIINLEDENENNIVDAVIAHEMAHQWWAHQVVGANMQGGTMLSESFAEYSSLMTMKNIINNPMKMRKFLKYNHDRYLRGRSGERKKELPLYKVENQGYIHYGKGSLILYALQDYIGEDKINTAMRQFLEEFKYKKPPYPTSLDFLDYLEPQLPDSLKYLIDDWFKEITLYDNRLNKAFYKKLKNKKYEVSLHVESTKIKADTIGNETKIQINDWIDLGVFADSEEENLLYQKRVKIDRPKMVFTFEVDFMPIKAAIDPRKLLIDRVYKDNIKSVEKKADN